MKQKLTLLILALFTTMGVWAWTIPTSDAYPVVGKTYYLYAIMHGENASRSYLYNDNGTLKVAEAYVDNNNYKWTVTKSGDDFIIKNVGTNKYLNVSSGHFILSNDSKAYSLSNSVSDAACVSIYSSGYYYVSPKVSYSVTYPNNYYITDLNNYGTPSNYSLNYIFEDAEITAPSLTNGAYYTIYCDNNSKQFLYDNSGTLTVGGYSYSSSNYIWKCIVSGDYYNLQNKSTDNYLGWKTVQVGSYNFIIGSSNPQSRATKARSTGMVTIYGPDANATGDGRFFLVKDDNTFSQADKSYEKGNTSYSADFRFVRVKTVTFSSAVAVNGGSAVSTIYVATDGSDSFTLPEGYKYSFGGKDYNAAGAAAAINAEGTDDINVTVTPILENNKLYRIQQTWTSGGTNFYYLYANISDGSNGNRLWKDCVSYWPLTIPTKLLTNENYIWKAESSDSNWKLYNKGGNRYIAKATDSNKDGSNVNGLSATSETDAEPFTLVSAETSNDPPADFNSSCYVALKATTQSRYLNSYSTGNKYVGWYDAAHAGYYFKFIPVKTVTFTTAVAVDGGSAVETIYVATDGSDSFTLPTTYKYTIGGVTYFAAGAAAAIAAAGTSDITVTVSSALISSTSQLSNTKCYTIQTANGRGVAVASGGTQLASTHELDLAYSVSDLKQQFAFVYYDGTDNSVDDGSYYMYSVSEKKFVSASGTGDGSAFNLSKLANQSVSFLSSGVAGYPVCIEMSNTADLNIRNDNNTPSVIVYGTSGSDKADGGNAVAIYEVADFDPTTALSTWNTREVTYELYYNDTKVDELVVDDEHPGVAEIPSSLDNGFMIYTYTPAVIPDEATTIRIDATWNGPFEFAATYNASTAKWYTVGIHSAYEGANHIWKYDGSQYVVTESVATNAFGSITNNHLFCFVGDPYSGFSIYNKTVGDSKTLYKSADTSNKAEMAAEGSLFVPSASTESGKTVANGYGCFKLKDASTRLNADAGASFIIKGWNDSGNGSTCWFLPEGEYYLTYLNSLLLTAPAGSVGTKAGITTEDVRSELIATKTALEANVFYLDTDKTAVEKATFKTTLNAINNSETIALSAGYYRIVNADPRFVSSQSKRPAIYYNGTDNLQWSINGLTADYQVNTIFKLEGSGTSYTMKSPNAEKYIQTSATSGQSEATGKLGASGASVTFTSLGSAQYNLKVTGDAQSIHANGHSKGAGAGSNLVQYNGGLDTPSAWYIVKVDGLDISLNGPVDSKYYATMCLPFDVTLDEACAYTLTLNGAKDGLTLSEATDNVPAGTPVLLRHTTNSIKASIASDASTGAPLSSTDLTGVFVNTDVTEKAATDYFLGNGSNGVGFYHWEGGTTLKANRAYFEAAKLSGSVKAFYGFDFDDDADAIKTLFDSPVKSENIYNLAGQRVSKMQKGINIVNGKKVLF